MDVVADRYYRSSGAVPFAGTLWMLAGGTAVAAVLALVYALICYYNPFVYFTFLATFVLGFATGKVVGHGSRKGKVRNPLFCSIVGLAVGSLAAYFGWVWYILILSEFEALIIDPLHMLGVLQFFAAEGLWSMRDWTPVGWQLYSFWIVEAGIVIVTATVTASKQEFPFCEACNCWTEPAEGAVAVLEKTDPEPLRSRLEAEDYNVLDELRRGERNPADLYVANALICPHCLDSNFLNVQHVVTILDKDGNEQVNANVLVKNLRIPESVVELLKEEDPAVAEAAAAEANELAEQAAGEEAPSDERDGETV